MSGNRRSSGIRRSSLSRPAVELAAAFVLGVLTSFGQQYLPEELHAVANSAASWSLIAFTTAAYAVPARFDALAQSSTRRWVASALVAMAALWLLLAGYIVASELRGYATGNSLVIFWGLAGLAVGPVLGVAAHAVRRGALVPSAIGTGLVAGVMLGESLHGVTTIGDSTSPVYWTLQAIGALVLLTAISRRVPRTFVHLRLATATAVVVALGFWSVYRLDLFPLV